MRTILINPVDETITVVELPDKHTIDDIYKALQCTTFGVISLGDGCDLFIDDEGLMSIPRSEEPSYEVTQGFFVLHQNGKPIHMIAGRALVTRHNENGDTVAVPERITVNMIAAFVHWIPKSRRNDAAEIGGELLNLMGIVESQEELEEKRQKEVDLVSRAYNLMP
jgi:hypothetical protein